MSIVLGDISSVKTVLFRFPATNSANIPSNATRATSASQSRGVEPEYWTERDLKLRTRVTDLWIQLVDRGFYSAPVTIREDDVERTPCTYWPMVTDGEADDWDPDCAEYLFGSIWNFTSVVFHPNKEMLVICCAGRDPYFLDDDPKQGPRLVKQHGSSIRVTVPHLALRDEGGKLMAIEA